MPKSHNFYGISSETQAKIYDRKNEALFNNAKGPYEEALKRSGYTTTLSYKPEVAGGAAPKRRRRRRKDNIIWFNPPCWCNSVKTDIGRWFL